MPTEDLQKTAIPADRSWYGTINVLRDLSELRVHEMLDNAAAKAPLEPGAKDRQGKVGAFYKSFMDEGGIEVLDAKPLAPELGAIRQASDRAKLAALMGKTRTSFESTLFDLVIFSDLQELEPLRSLRRTRRARHARPRLLSFDAQFAEREGLHRLCGEDARHDRLARCRRKRKGDHRLRDQSR